MGAKSGHKVRFARKLSMTFDADNPSSSPLDRSPIKARAKHSVPAKNRRNVGRRDNLFLTVFLILFLGVLVPAALIVLGWNPHGARVLLVFPFLVAVYSTAMMARELRRPIVNQLRMFFYTFTYVSFGTSTIPQLLNNRFPWKGVYSIEEIVVTYMYVLAGLLVFEIISLVTSRRQIVRPENAPIRPSNSAVILSFGFIFFSAVLLFASGWYRVMFQPRVEAGVEIYGQLGAESAVQLQLRSMHGFSLVGTIILVFAGWGKRVRYGFAIWFLRCAALLAMAYTMTIANPISTSRAWFATVLIALGGAWMQIAWPAVRRYFAVITAIGYLFVFPLTDIYRSQYDLAAFQQSQVYSLKENIAESFFNGDFDSFQQVMNARRAIEIDGYQLGRQMIGTVLFWFPRSLWPSKPLNSGDWIAITVGYDYTNLSAPLWAEGIVDFGFIGALVYLAAYAVLTQWLYRKECLWTAYTPYYLTAVLVTAPYSIYLLRGGLLSCVAYITPSLLALAVLICVDRVHARTTQAD